MTLKKIMSIVVRAAKNGISPARLRRIWNRLLTCNYDFRVANQYQQKTDKADLLDVGDSWPQDIIEFCQLRFDTKLSPAPPHKTLHPGHYDETSNTVRCIANWSVLAHELGHAMHVAACRRRPGYVRALSRHLDNYFTASSSHRLLEMYGARYSPIAAGILREILPTNPTLQKQIDRLYLDSLDWHVLLHLAGVRNNMLFAKQTTTAPKLMRKFLEICFAANCKPGNWRSLKSFGDRQLDKQQEVIGRDAWFIPGLGGWVGAQGERVTAFGSPPTFSTKVV